MEKFLVKVGRNYHFFDKEEIDWIESDGNYLKIFIGDESYILRMTLKTVEQKLNTNFFMRINRSTIINTNRIKQLLDINKSEFTVVLDNERTLKWGRHYKKNLSKFLKLN